MQENQLVDDSLCDDISHVCLSFDLMFLLVTHRISIDLFWHYMAICEVHKTLGQKWIGISDLALYSHLYNQNKIAKKESKIRHVQRIKKALCDARLLFYIGDEDEYGNVKIRFATKHIYREFNGVIIVERK